MSSFFIGADPPARGPPPAATPPRPPLPPRPPRPPRNEDMDVEQDNDPAPAALSSAGDVAPLLVPPTAVESMIAAPGPAPAAVLPPTALIVAPGPAPAADPLPEEIVYDHRQQTTGHALQGPRRSQRLSNRSRSDRSDRSSASSISTGPLPIEDPPTEWALSPQLDRHLRSFDQLENNIDCPPQEENSI